MRRPGTVLVTRSALLLGLSLVATVGLALGAPVVPAGAAIVVHQASAMTDPDTGGSSTGVLLGVLGIVVLAGLCLWLLFRRGSIAHRAEVDWPVPDDDPTPDSDSPDPPR